MGIITCGLAPGINASLAPGIDAALAVEIAAAASMSRGIYRERKAQPDARRDHYTKTLENVIATNKATGAQVDLGDGSSVAIADGEYSLSVRSSADLWEGAANNSTYSLIVSGGEITLQSQLPTISSLTAVRTSATEIEIQISGFVADCRIGLWFSPITPVVVTGPADIELEVLQNFYSYRYEYAQTAAEYVAVACLTDTETGIPAELYLPLIPSILTSPENQFAQP